MNIIRTQERVRVFYKLWEEKIIDEFVVNAVSLEGLRITNENKTVVLPWHVIESIIVQNK